MWPFSTCDRAGLLAGYTPYGCEWQGGFEELDYMVSVKGIADLYGAVFDAPADRPTRTMEKRQAIALGACYVAVLVHLAVRDCAPRDVFPRAMALTVGYRYEIGGATEKAIDTQLSAGGVVAGLNLRF